MLSIANLQNCRTKGCKLEHGDREELRSENVSWGRWQLDCTSKDGHLVERGKRVCVCGGETQSVCPGLS